MDSHRRTIAIIAVGGMLTAALAATVFKAVLSNEKEPLPQEAPPATPTGNLADLLGQCRSYSSTHRPTEPDWDRAELSCDRALDLDPINAEAHELMRRIRFERDMANNYEKGKRALERSGEEEALDHLGAIKRNSYYYAAGKALAATVVDKAKKKAADDCRRYVQAKRWTQAKPRCERYMVLACQNMSEDELTPVREWRNWRPKDEIYRLFLLARERLGANATTWKCPRVEVLADPTDTGANLRSEVRRMLDQKYSDKEIAVALELYWANRLAEAKLELQKLLSQTHRSEAHALASDTMKNIDRAAALRTDGENALQRDDFNGADRRFAEALEYDAALTQALPASHPSEIRQSIQRSFTKKAFELGKRWANRGDFRRACTYWRRGYGYYGGNLDLPKARRVCSEIAKENLDQAADCGALARVLDFAMDGDGIKEKINARRVEMKCH